MKHAQDDHLTNDQLLASQLSNIEVDDHYDDDHACPCMDENVDGVPTIEEAYPSYRHYHSP